MSVRDEKAGRLKSFYEAHPLLVWSTLTAGPVALLAFLCIAWPDVFYTGFVDKYYWTPIKEDQHYNAVDTATYALLAVACLTGLHEIGRFTRTPFSPAMVASLVPFVIFGGLARALEDTELVAAPARYLFITPIIYLLIALGIALPLFLLSAWLEGRKERWRVLGVCGAIAGMVAAYAVAYLTLGGFFAFMVHPAIVFVTGTAAMASYVLLQGKSTNRVPLAMAVFGFFLLLCAAEFMTQWPGQEDWLTAYIRARNWEIDTAWTPDTEWHLLATVPTAAALIAVATAGPGMLLRGWSKFADALAKGENVLLVWAQMFDGVATFVGIDMYGYSEKHVLPTYLIDAAGGAWVMLPLKFGLALLAVYLLDIVYGEDMAKNPALAGLVKLIIVLVGVGPGSRDVFRLAMGV